MTYSSLAAEVSHTLPRLELEPLRGHHQCDTLQMSDQGSRLQFVFVTAGTIPLRLAE